MAPPLGGALELIIEKWRNFLNPGGLAGWSSNLYRIIPRWSFRSYKNLVVLPSPGGAREPIIWKYVEHKMNYGALSSGARWSGVILKLEPSSSYIIWKINWNFSTIFYKKQKNARVGIGELVYLTLTRRSPHLKLKFRKKIAKFQFISYMNPFCA